MKFVKYTVIGQVNLLKNLASWIDLIRLKLWKEW